MKEMVDKGRRPLSIWILLLYVPLGLQLLFWMMGFHYVDFSLPKQFVELPMALIRYYASLTLLLHPLIYAYGLFHSLHLNRIGAKASKVLLSSLLPFASAGPYLIGERIWQYFQ
ncbi:hypothetical protein [Ferrimonas lipolytica]|uniref:Uncharacterized protein n=1 Tax=Ferrimonas lipolytica TaxID=2724191 RepID=A0A6H1UDV2_9GAMM|nr:hypothetical protein [Ferrimonas lipolytica]QIZ77224.1 hypothetical protein HER31_10240 [Ferrimonas lipolytica]